MSSAGPGPARHPACVARGEDGLGDRGRGTHHEGVEFADRGHQLSLAEPGPNLDLAQLPEPGQTVLGELVRDQDPRH